MIPRLSDFSLLFLKCFGLLLVLSLKTHSFETSEYTVDDFPQEMEFYAYERSKEKGNSNSNTLPVNMDPLDLKNGMHISSVYELQGNKNLKLLFYFFYGSNSYNVQKIALNPRIYSKYIIIQSK